MYGFWARAGTLAIAGALLFLAYNMHGSSRKYVRHASIVMSFVAGLAFLVTFVGSWMSSAEWFGGFAVAGLIVCLSIIVVDWMWDKKPDKKAFWAAFALALFIVLGAANLDQASSNVIEGGKMVGEELEKIGDNNPARNG